MARMQQSLSTAIANEVKEIRMSIEIRNIDKKFAGFHALNDINLDIESGELIALLGPSGCGKTTLLRIIAGLESTDQGSILFSGEDTTHVHVRQRQVGFVFQHYALFRHMTVFENVAFGLRVRPRALRPSEAQIREKVQALLSLVQLDWLADRYPAQLSGGQRQRIALARALAVEPRVLLLDEPFGALDAKVRKELRRWLRRLHDDLNVTTLFVTHDQEEALEVADRVVIMNKGKIEQVGAPHAVWESPASPFVYGFLGDVNLFHGRAHEGQVHLSEQALSLQSPEHEHLQDTKVMAFIRPHDFYVRRYRAEDQGMTARLNRVVLVGPIARMELEVLEGSQAAVPMRVVEVQISATEWKDQNFKEGEILLLSPRKAKVFLAEVA